MLMTSERVHRSLNVYSGVKGYPELQCLSITSTAASTALESIVISPEYYGFQVTPSQLTITNEIISLNGLSLTLIH